MTDPSVVWIKVPPPTFDLAGVVLGALGLAGLLAVTTIVLGGLLGTLLILRRRQTPAQPPLLLALNTRPGQG